MFVRVAYVQDERQLVRGSPEEFGFVRPEQRQPFILLKGNPHKQVASVSTIFDGTLSTIMGSPCPKMCALVEAVFRNRTANFIRRNRNKPFATDIHSLFL